jgi:uncharacterized membrane protein
MEIVVKMNFTKLTNSIINKFIDEMKKEENNEKLKTYVIDPCICHIMNKFYPYLIISAIIFILIFLISILILFLMIRSSITT